MRFNDKYLGTTQKGSGEEKLTSMRRVLVEVDTRYILSENLQVLLKVDQQRVSICTYHQQDLKLRKSQEEGGIVISWGETTPTQQVLKRPWKSASPYKTSRQAFLGPNVIPLV